LRFRLSLRFSVTEANFGEVTVASWADPLSEIDAAEGRLVTVWAEFFVHRNNSVRFRIFSNNYVVKFKIDLDVGFHLIKVLYRKTAKKMPLFVKEWWHFFNKSSETWGS
jgi:hypothetical protein